MRVQNWSLSCSQAVVALLTALMAMSAGAQATAAPDAGQLLEQQRRAAEQRAQEPRPAAKLMEEAPAKAPGTEAPGGATRFTVRAFSLTGNTSIDTAALQAELALWTGREITLADLRQATVALEALYRQRGWLARVVLPSQDITEGTVRLQVTEARAGKVIVAPAEPPPAASLANRARRLVEAHLEPGAPLDLQAVERAVLLADELPGLRAAGSLQAGAAAGTTDVLLQITPTPAARYEFYADNAAAAATGSHRLTAVVTADAPFGYGEQLGLTGSHTQGSDYLRGALMLPLGDRGLRVTAQASTLRYRVLDSYNTTTAAPPRGKADTLGVDAQYPLVRRASQRLNALLGIEEKRQTDGSADSPVHTGQSRLHFGLEGSAFDRLGGGGSTQARLQLSSARLSLAGSPDAHVANDSLTAATQGRALKLSYSVRRVQELAPQWALHAGVSGQWANRNLGAGERFYLGGQGGVNAYPSGEAGGSQGQLLNLELRHQFAPHRSGQWQAGVLADVGRVKVYSDNRRADGAGPLTSDNQQTLKGAGVSLGWRGEGGAFVQAVLARRIGSNPLATPAGTDTDGSLRKNRLWVSAGIAF
jgi:hemolysin activation/secretion protein